MKFDRLGIRFQYPENWTLETDEAAGERATVTAYSPGGGFWSVVRHPPESDPAELAASVLAAMRAEYDELDSEAAGEEVASVELTGYDLNFYCLDLTNTAIVRVAQTAEATYLVVYQAEDRDFDKLQQVFRAMTVSLLQ